MGKLCQVVAVEKDVKSRALGAATRVNNNFQRPALFNGFVKSYTPREEDGETFPNDRKLVQFKVEDCLKDVADHLTDLFDVTATKDFGNTTAKADLVVDGIVLLKDVPPTFLLFLEKQLKHVHTIIENVPTNSLDDDWSYDENKELWKTEMARTNRTTKEPEVITLAPATKEHPAQTQLIYVDKAVGWWEQTKFSGGVSTKRKRVLLERVNTLSRAVKRAREEANSTEAPNKEVGKTLFNFLLKD